jgi:predicted phosphodiesterase
MTLKRIVAISDTHTLHSRMNHPLPDGDILIHAGDFCNYGNLWEVEAFSDWLFTLGEKFSNIIVIAGNHDWPLQTEKPLAKKCIEDTGAIYLENDSADIGGLKFWGSPATRYFCNWAFNYSEEQLKVIWNSIPEDVNILITHSMPLGILDLVRSNENVGEVGLLKRIKQLKDLKVYIGGHLHLEGGNHKILGDKLYINASICDEEYIACRKPTVFDIDDITKEFKLVGD